MRILLYGSIFLNVILVLAGIYYAQRRWQFQNRIISFHNYASNPQYAEQINLESVYFGEGKIVMLGNSHFYKAHWDELLSRNDVINRGIGSDITLGYLHRLNYVLNSHPSICFIEGGSNDIAFHVPLDSIISNLSLLIDTLRQCNIIPVLHTVIYAAKPYPNSETFNVQIDALNLKIQKLAHAENVDLIDINALLSEDGFLKDEFCQADHNHLTWHYCHNLKWKTEIEKVLKKHSF